MTAVHLVTLRCNRCGAMLDYDSWGSTAAESRDNARDAGWSCTNRTDICPEHEEN